MTNAQWQVELAIQQAQFENKPVTVEWQVLKNALRDAFQEGYEEGCETYRCDCGV